jgi:hypothetical protein
MPCPRCPPPRCPPFPAVLPCPRVPCPRCPVPRCPSPDMPCPRCPPVPAVLLSPLSSSCPVPDVLSPLSCALSPLSVPAVPACPRWPRRPGTPEVGSLAETMKHRKNRHFLNSGWCRFALCLVPLDLLSIMHWNGSLRRTWGSGLCLGPLAAMWKRLIRFVVRPVRSGSGAGASNSVC